MNKLADSFFTRFTQARRLLRLELGKDSPIASEDVIVESFTGRETIDGEFTYAIRVLADRDDLALDALIGRAIVLLLDTGATPRRFHGHVVGSAHAGSDGGFAAYTIHVAAWTFFLDQRRDWWVFQEKSAVAIIEEVFGDWKEGAVQANFEWRLSRPAVIPNRSYCVQAGETDLHFVRRLMEEEGLCSWFEIQGEGDETKHVLVIADDPAAYRPLARIRFHRQAATEATDSIIEWSARRQVRLNRVSLTSHDYKPSRSTAVSLDSAMKSGDALPQLEQYRTRGEYGYKDLEAGEREAVLRLQAEESLAKRFTGAGNVRSMRVGATFELVDHPAHDRDNPSDREFVLLAIEHEGKNNLGLESREGAAKEALSPGAYTNRFDAIRKNIEHRPARVHAKPHMPGTQTARITGPNDTEVYTDRLNRVRVQFHWDRQAGDTHENDERSSCWVRVATPNADSDWGGVFVPRVGQEVVVSFLDGDPDRPLVTGRVYNGPRSPTWHSDGKLAGLKSKQLAGEGYNALVQDDSTGQLRTTLGSTQYASQLNLGYHVSQPFATTRGENRGQGLEARTDASGALRAAKGLLLTADARPNASGQQMDAREAAAGLEQHAARLKANGELAEKHRAQSLPSHQSATKTVESIGHTEDDVAVFKDPHLVLSAPAGLTATTPHDIHLASGASTAMSAGKDMNVGVGGTFAASVKKAISLFAYKGGVKLFAGKGKVDLQAQCDNLEAAADKEIKLIAVNGQVFAAAGKKITLTAAGAYITLEGGNIKVHAPGLISIKGAQHQFAGATKMGVSFPSWETGMLKHWIAVELLDPVSGEPLPQTPYEIHFVEGSVVKGELGAEGRARRDDIPDAPVEKVLYKPRRADPESAHEPMEKLLGGSASSE